MTTLVIDRGEGFVVSDSRGTIEKETLSLKLLPYPCVKRKKDKTYLTVKKIFEVNNHIIVGCGSLNILEFFVHKVKMYNFHFDNTYYYKFDHDVDIHWCFDKIRTLMTTKKGSLRKTMEDLKPYQAYELSALLEYLRKEWREGNTRVIISWREKKILEGGKLL